jgi:hypothetical protein
MRVLSENEKEKSMALKFKYKSKAEVPAEVPGFMWSGMGR